MENYQLFSTYFQNIESLLKSPKLSNYQELYKKYELPPYNKTFLKNYENAISLLLYKSIILKNKEITKQLIENNEISELKNKLLDSSITNKGIERLFEFVFQTIKNNKPYNFNLNNQEVDYLKVPFISLFKKSTKILVQQLFPNQDNDQDQEEQECAESLFSDENIEEFFSNSPNCKKITTLASKLIKSSIKPIINEKMIFRILEIGGGTCSLSLKIINEINNLLLKNKNMNKNVMIEIEYTYTDVNPLLIDNARIELKSLIPSNFKIIFRNLNIQNSIIDQGYFKNYYDIIAIEQVLHFLKDIEFSIQQIHSILKKNGHLIIIEPPYRSIVLDSVFGAFPYWWDFKNGNYRNDRCCLNQLSWLNLLSSSSSSSSNSLFNNINYSKDNESLPFLIQCQKSNYQSSSSSSSSSSNNIIIFGKINSNLKKSFYNSILLNKSDNQIITIIEDINKLIIYENSIIYFIKTIDKLEINEIEQVSNEYQSINKLLLNSNLTNCKHVIISTNLNSTNYLNSSIIGLMKYYKFKNQNLNLYNIDFNINNNEQQEEEEDREEEGVFNNIEIMNDINNMNNNSFFIINNEIYNEMYKKEQVDINHSIIIKTDIGRYENCNSYSGGDGDGTFTSKDGYLKMANQSLSPFIFIKEKNNNNEFNEFLKEIKEINSKINNLNNFIIEYSIDNNNNNNNIYYYMFNSIIESISNYRKSINLSSTLIIHKNQQFKSISSLISSNLNLINNKILIVVVVFISNKINNNGSSYGLDENKIDFYLLKKYKSSTIKKELINIIKMVFNLSEISIINNFNKTLKEITNKENQESTQFEIKFKEFINIVDDQILKNAISIDQLNSYSINSIISFIKKKQQSEFEFFKKHHKDEK